MARLSVRRPPAKLSGPPCATCGVPLKEGARVCPHCGLRLDRPARSVPLYQKQTRGKSVTTDVILIVGSLGLIMGVLVLALVPFLFSGGTDASSEEQPVVAPPPAPDSPPMAEAVPPAVPGTEAAPTVARPLPPARPEPAAEPRPPPVEPVVIALPADPPEGATLDDLLRGYALGQDGYWAALAQAVRERVTAEVDERVPLITTGQELALRAAAGQVVRGPLLGRDADAVRVGTAGEATVLAYRELAYEERLRLDPAYREAVIDARVMEYIFRRLPAHRRADDPPPGISGEDLVAAARRGSVQAARRAGLAHLSDVGQDPDRALAFTWLLPAAKWGDAEAQYHLGLLYYEGAGVKRDERLALGWMGRASGQGYEPAYRFVAAHRQRKVASRRMEEEAAQALESRMRQEAAWLEEAAARPPVTLFKRGSEGMTVGADSGVTPGP